MAYSNYARNNYAGMNVPRHTSTYFEVKSDEQLARNAEGKAANMASGLNALAQIRANQKRIAAKKAAAK